MKVIFQQSQFMRLSLSGRQCLSSTRVADAAPLPSAAVTAKPGCEGTPVTPCLQRMSAAAVDMPERPCNTTPTTQQRSQMSIATGLQRICTYVWFNHSYRQTLKPARLVHRD
jgi:hypothetical protein